MVEDKKPPARHGAVWAGLAVAAAAAALGLAVEFGVLAARSVPGDGCGGHDDPCPSGFTPTITLTFVLGFGGFFALASTLFWFGSRRPGKAVPAVLVLGGVLLSLWPGRLAYVAMRGPVLDSVWQAARDRPSTVRAQGVWSAGGGAASTVVRVRTDALVGYGSRAGDRRWTLRAPVRESVCGMSRSVADGIGVVAFGRYNKPCDTVWGIDLRTGRAVWKHTVKGTDGLPYSSDSLLAVDGDVAVALTGSGVQAYGLTDGRPRWNADLGGKGHDEADCTPVVVSASGSTTRVVTECRTQDRSSGRLITLDNATGKQRDSRALPVESPIERAVVVSAEPFTLLLQESDERGVAAVLAYPAGDGAPVRIPLAGDDEDLTPLPNEEAFGARPALRATVSGDTLVVAAQKPDAFFAERVSGYSLRDGRRLWHADLNEIDALSPLGHDRVAVLGGDPTSSGSRRLWTLDAADGHRFGPEGGVMVRTDGPSGSAQLLRTGDTWIVVNADGTSKPPLLGLR